MTHSDLRIGNYVRIKDNNTIVKVERISRRKVGFFYNGDKTRGYFRKYSEIEGVLIFDHWQDTHYSGLLWIGNEDDDTKYWYCHANYPDRKFRYIHELQNIHHALTGEEIEIEL